MKWVFVILSVIVSGLWMANRKRNMLPVMVTTAPIPAPKTEGNV